MQKFFEEQRTLAFLGAVLLALAGWGSDFKTWAEMFQVSNVFGLVMVLGGLFMAWGTKRPGWLTGASQDPPAQKPEVKP